MTKHRLHYIDMRPKPLANNEPSTLAVWLGAATALAALYLVTVILFSF
jgi:hypothetical protein